MTTKWACPKCGIDQDGCHKRSEKVKHACQSGRGTAHACLGFICECPEDEPTSAHGCSYSDPCEEARCYHCGWVGTVPVPLRGIHAWERTALAAGWTPPSGWQEKIKQGKGKA